MNESHYSFENITSAPGFGAYDIDYETEEYETVFGVYDIRKRARIILSRPRKQIALFLAFVAILINILSLLALSKVRNRITTHFRFIISLSLSDILISLTEIVLTVNKILNPVIVPGTGTSYERARSRCAFIVIKSLNTVGLNVTLLNLMAMSIDHYVAITQPLHYSKIMSKLRCRFVIISIWTISTICGLSDFLSVPSSDLFGVVFNLTLATPMFFGNTFTFNVCEIALITTYTEEFTVLANTALCFLIMCFVYVRICVVVRRHRSPGEHSQQRVVNRNRCTIYTTLLILGCFCVCWIPNCCFQILLLLQLHYSGSLVQQDFLQTMILLNEYMYCLLLLNCICDPIIYTVRTFDVKLGYRRFFKCCCSRNVQYYHITRKVAMRRKFSRHTALTSSLRLTDGQNWTYGIVAPDCKKSNGFARNQHTDFLHKVKYSKICRF